MAKNEARRQKQLAKKKAKRQEKRTLIARETSPNPVIRLAQAASWPVETALVPVPLWEEGIGQLIIARKEPGGRLSCSFFLVDTLCLGIKDAFWRSMVPGDFYDIVKDTEEKLAPFEKVSPEYFAKLVFGAADFAQSFGFPPHADYRAARMLLDGIDPSLCTETFEFGENGRPLYINGPHDSPERIRAIIHQIRQVGGHFDLFNLSEEFLDEFQLSEEPPSTRAWRTEE